MNPWTGAKRSPPLRPASVSIFTGRSLTAAGSVEWQIQRCFITVPVRLCGSARRQAARSPQRRPLSPAFDLVFKAADNLLVAGTLGRGAWAMPDVSGSLTPLLLQARRSDSSLIISWPSPSTGFGLQQNTTLATTDWTSVAQTPADDG